MYNSTMVYMRIIIATLTCLTCLLGDNFVEISQNPLLKALADNATHAAIGALSGIAFVVQFYEKTSHFFGWLLIFVCFICSSLIDVDHFIAARSWNLEDATNLTRRPFLHCSTLIALILIAYLSAACLNYFKWSLLLGSILCAFVTHHSRDATRRGYWIYPWGNTERISNLSYIIATIITPYIVGYLHSLCRAPTVQEYLGQYIKFNDNFNQREVRGYRYMQV
ncbi:transmembrane protein 267 [Stomoxys calcitrans]|uniref:transmembrane protein 267 n=1 Tax=Stomoxys calcitrans TaxID=35570 RepID=UPI0027E270C0|nr:transmembrane protein 267 [Stomoxys calcitrans]